MPDFETLTLSVEDKIATVRLNRPDKLNAMNAAMWNDIRSAFRYIDETPDIRVAILEGEGKAFTAGIDLQMMLGVGAQVRDECDGRTRENLRRVILDLQDTLTSLERCRKPVLAAVHGACVGGGDRSDQLRRHALLLGRRLVHHQGNRYRHGGRRRHPATPATADRRRHGARTGLHRAQVRRDRSEGHALVNRVFESPEALRAGVREIAAGIAAKSITDCP